VADRDPSPDDLATTLRDLVRQGYEVRFRPAGTHGVALLLDLARRGHEEVTSTMSVTDGELDEVGFAPARVLADYLDVMAGR
jgi:hypothetical protein